MPADRRGRYASAARVAARYAGKKDYGRESTDDPNLLTYRVGEEGYRLVCTCFYGGEVVGFVVAEPLDIDWDHVELHKIMREDFPGVKLPPLKEHEDLSPLAEELDRRGAVEGIPEALADYRGILRASGKKRLDIYQVESSFLDKKWRGTRAGQHMYLHLIHRLAEMSAVLVPGSWPSDKADYGTSTSARRVWKSLGSYATVVGLIAWGGGARDFPPLVSRPRGFDTPEKARRRKLTADGQQLYREGESGHSGAWITPDGDFIPVNDHALYASAARVAARYAHRIISPDHHLTDPDTGLYRWTPERVRAAWVRSTADLDAALADGGVSRVVLMVGIPASGKTTWLSRNAEPGIVYFDATFKDARARRPIVDVARRHGVPVDAVVMATPLDEAIRRNDTRTPDRRVPDDVMARMYADLTGGGMPTRDEGFDRITVVRPGA